MTLIIQADFDAHAPLIVSTVKGKKNQTVKDFYPSHLSNPLDLNQRDYFSQRISYCSNSNGEDPACGEMDSPIQLGSPVGINISSTYIHICKYGYE
jgi:hypothetical protein